MTITRHPTGYDLACLVCLKPGPGLDIDHVVNRGSGGSKERDVPENKVPLCRECHDLKTVGRIETYVDGRDEFYQYHWRRKAKGSPWISNAVEVSERYKCLVRTEVVPSDGRPEQPNIDQREVGREGQVLGAAAEGPMTDSSDCSPSAAAPSAKEESDAETNAEVGRGKVTGIPGESVTGASALRGTAGTGNPGESRLDEDEAGDSLARIRPLTHEQRVAIAQEIKNTEWNRQFFAGDTGNLWIEQLGESAEQYLSDFGYTHESLANILRVCAAIPPPYRNGNLRFSHHVVVAGENREDMEMWLDKCEEEQWSVAEFRRQVKGTKKKERHACPDCGAEHQVKS